MTLKKIGFPAIMRDNDMQYISLVLGTIEKMDKTADITIIKTLESYSFAVITSERLRDKMIVCIQVLHDTIHIPIEFSYTVKIAHSINFSLVV